MAFGNRTSKAAPGGNSNSGSKYSKGGSGSGGQKQQSNFIKIGDITARKSLLESSELYGEICDALDQSGFAFNVKVYLGKGGEELVLKSGDFLNISFKRGDKAPDFVLGTISLAAE